MKLHPSTWDWAAHDVVLAGLAAGWLVAALLAWRLSRSQMRHRAGHRPRLRDGSTPLNAPRSPDEVAGLMNRARFDLALDEECLRCDRGAGGFCLLYVDMDNLRSINDAFGHDHGDAVLREAARRVAELSGGTACRIAADEFAVITQGDLKQGHDAAEMLRAGLSQPFHMAGQLSHLTCSVGIAAYPAHGSRPMLLGNAILAMRTVKLAGGAGQAEYQAQMGVGKREQAALLSELRVALERGQFELYFQPKVDAGSLQITAAEALLRWRHPQRGMISPGLFIPLAERHGLIAAIGNWVLEEACRQSAQWRERGLRMRVAINLSGYQMRQDDFVDRIRAALVAHRIPAGRLTCEITESVAMEDTQATQQAFERLRAVGVHVSIDDFGTGYSSLASLRRLPAAELKIDRAFVCDLDSSVDARSIAQAIVQMAHTLGLRVVAEGVETEAQRDFLVSMGCDELQGYLFAKPMTAKALELWATNDGPETDGAFSASLFDETRPADLTSLN